MYEELTEEDINELLDFNLSGSELSELGDSDGEEEFKIPTLQPIIIDTPSTLQLADETSSTSTSTLLQPSTSTTTLEPASETTSNIQETSIRKRGRVASKQKAASKNQSSTSTSTLLQPSTSTSTLLQPASETVESEPRPRNKTIENKERPELWFPNRDNKFNGYPPKFEGNNNIFIEGETPYEFFKKMFPETLITHIHFETMRYAKSSNPDWKFSVAELKVFLGINIIMTYIKYPSCRMYWSSEQGLRFGLIANSVLTINRFEEIKRYLHFENNENEHELKKTDKFWKVRPVANALLQTFHEAASSEEHQSIDEMMVPFKGHSHLKQYIKSKPKMWGFKIWVKASSSGYVSKFELCNVSVVRWMDNSPVHTISTYAGVTPEGHVRRWDRSEKKHIEISRPYVITEYNQFMGGVDLMDRMLAHYPHDIKSKKWYFRVFFHLLNMSIVNAWLLYRRKVDSKCSLLHFKANVAASLIAIGDAEHKKKKTGRPSAGEEPVKKRRIAPAKQSLELRFDGVGHNSLKVPAMHAPRCHSRLCKKRTRYSCQKYLEPVCPECMDNFHNKSKG